MFSDVSSSGGVNQVILSCLGVKQWSVHVIVGLAFAYKFSLGLEVQRSDKQDDY